MKNEEINQSRITAPIKPLRTNWPNEIALPEIKNKWDFKDKNRIRQKTKRQLLLAGI